MAQLEVRARRAECRQGRQGGTGDHRRRDRDQRDRRAEAGSGEDRASGRPSRASSRSATRTSRPTTPFGIQGNQDLFLNTINWLAQQENLISIRPKPPSDSHLTITGAAGHGGAVMSLLVVPGARLRHGRLHVVEEALT